MGAPDPDNEVFRNVLTIILSVLAGIAVCAGIAGILYALGVIVVHMGECKDKAGTGSDTSTVDPTPSATVIQPAPATVYRHPKVKKEASGRIYVMFAKVKNAAGGDDLYQNYRFTMILDYAPQTPVQTSDLNAFDPDDKTANNLSKCPNDGAKPNHHVDTYLCIMVTHANIGTKFKFTYQPLDAGDKPVANKLSEESGEVEGAATETNPFQQIVAGGKSSFITTIAAAAASGFMTAIILVAVMNFFKKKEPAKERLVAKYDATVV
eukprot:783410_1